PRSHLAQRPLDSLLRRRLEVHFGAGLRGSPSGGDGIHFELASLTDAKPLAPTGRPGVARAEARCSSSPARCEAQVPCGPRKRSERSLSATRVTAAAVRATAISVVSFPR